MAYGHVAGDGQDRAGDGVGAGRADRGEEGDGDETVREPSGEGAGEGPAGVRDAEHGGIGRPRNGRGHG